MPPPLPTAISGLSVEGLRSLQTAVEHEVVTACRRGEPPGPFVELLDVIEQRIERRTASGPPTLERRAQIRAESESIYKL